MRVLDINCHRTLNPIQGIFDHSENSKKDSQKISEICEKHQNVAIDHMIKNFDKAKELF